MGPSLSVRPGQKEQQKSHSQPPFCMFNRKAGREHHQLSRNVITSSPRISILALLVCSILLLLLTGGLLQSWGPSPWASGTGPTRHLEPLCREPECPGVGNNVWVRATALSSWPSYFGNSLWPNSPTRNRQPVEKGSGINYQGPTICFLVTARAQQPGILLTLQSNHSLPPDVASDPLRRC